MKISQILISVFLLVLLVAVNEGAGGVAAELKFGGLTWIGWLSVGVFLVGVGLVVALSDIAKSFSFLKTKKSDLDSQLPVRKLTEAELAELKITKYKGPDYPHPVIFTDRCIGCQACVDACPHDVLAIVGGRASVIGADQCMEDTSCQVECPVNPKACIVINTTKKIRARPAPVRDGATYMTNVPGCYIIGDVSGVPLIKNAVKEGGEVVEYIAEELAAAKPEPKAEYDVAIIGIGPGGASAAMTAHEKGLRYVGIEQEKILSTIVSYPKGKYIFFKPDTKDWNGGLSVAGLGLVKGKYESHEDEDAGDEMFNRALSEELERIAGEQAGILRGELIEKIPPSLHSEFTPLVEDKAKKEIKKRFYQYLREKIGAGNFASSKWRETYQTNFTNLEKTQQDSILSAIRRDIADTLEHKIPGDQRERILSIWIKGLEEKGVRINEEEGCKSIKRAENGDYFVVETQRKDPQTKMMTPFTYRARRVILAIGLRGSPNKLRVKGEDGKDAIKVNVSGEPENKVLYSLSNPDQYKNRSIIVVGGGNSAVEAAVDLVARREGATITPRPPEEINKVTLLVRSYIATNVKFGNKLQLYQCMDDGLLEVRFGAAIKELRETEVVIENTKTKEVIATIPNDYVFALIGGERPDKFLESIGISISKT